MGAIVLLHETFLIDPKKSLKEYLMGDGFYMMF